MRVFLTGGTGLVGTRLIERLLARGDQVVLLSRRPDAAKNPSGDRCTVVAGDPTEAGPWMDELKTCDGAVHLAGEGLMARRWNAEFKERIRASRVKGTANVSAAICKQPRKADGTAKVLVSASAIGYYGPHGVEELREDALPGSDFLAGVCADWEKAAVPAQECGVRVVFLRTGIVLDSRGGPLMKMVTPVKWFAGGPVGSGKQVMSWIHHEDEIGLILFALDNSQVQGPLNAASPGAVTNKQFVQALGRVLHRPSFLPMPRFALRGLLGEASDVVATGQRVVPQKALDLGYRFHFTDVDAALRDLLSPP